MAEFQWKVWKHKLFYTICLWISYFFQIFTFIGSSVICLSLSEIPIWTHQREFGLNCGGIVTMASAAHTRPWPKYRITHSQIQCRKNPQTFTARWAGEGGGECWISKNVIVLKANSHEIIVNAQPHEITTTVLAVIPIHSHQTVCYICRFYSHKNPSDHTTFR